MALISRRRRYKMAYVAAIYVASRLRWFKRVLFLLFIFQINLKLPCWPHFIIWIRSCLRRPRQTDFTWNLAASGLMCWEVATTYLHYCDVVRPHLFAYCCQFAEATRTYCSSGLFLYLSTSVNGCAARSTLASRRAISSPKKWSSVTLSATDNQLWYNRRQCCWHGDALSRPWALRQTHGVPGAYSWLTSCSTAPCCWSCRWPARYSSGSVMTW